MKTHWLQTILTGILLFAFTTAIFLYTSGYRLSQQETSPTIDLKRTGIISAKSIPEGANVYVNNILKTATDDTVSALEPGTYTLKIVRNGFVTWEKEVDVFAELVTDITAVLVSQSPRLEPLTNTGARVPVISPSLNKLAYFSKDGEESGIWILSLTNTGGISLFRSEPYVAIEDTFNTIYSNGNSIEWSPDETELLVQDAAEVYHLIDIAAQTTTVVADADAIRQDWATETLQDRTDFLQRIDIPQEMFNIATSQDNLWSPDEKKFLYKVEKNGQIEYRVYNMEKPIPVGEKVDNLAFTTNAADPQPAISWYADSFHLILAEGNIEEEQKGVISLIRIDGTNKTEVFNSAMHSPNVYSTPGGDKLIFLTSFKSSGQTDLYTIGIR